MLAAKRPTREEIPSLYAELKKVPAPRDEQGQRHPLPATPADKQYAAQRLRGFSGRETGLSCAAARDREENR